MPLLLLAGFVVVGFWLAGGSEAPPSKPAPSPEPPQPPRPTPPASLPPGVKGTILATAQNGFMLVQPETDLERARMQRLAGPTPVGMEGIVVADPVGTYVTVFYRPKEDRPILPFEVRKVEVGDLSPVEREPLKAALLQWEANGALVFYDPSGVRVSLRTGKRV